MGSIVTGTITADNNVRYHLVIHWDDVPHLFILLLLFLFSCFLRSCSFDGSAVTFDLSCSCFNDFSCGCPSRVWGSMNTTHEPVSLPTDPVVSATAGEPFHVLQQHGHVVARADASIWSVLHVGSLQLNITLDTDRETTQPRKRLPGGGVLQSRLLSLSNTVSAVVIWLYVLVSPMHVREGTSFLLSLFQSRIGLWRPCQK